MVADGAGGVSGRSGDVSGTSHQLAWQRSGNLTRRRVELDRPIIVPHLETLVIGSESRRHHLCHLVIRLERRLISTMCCNGFREGHGRLPTPCMRRPNGCGSALAAQLHVI